MLTIMDSFKNIINSKHHNNHINHNNHNNHNNRYSTYTLRNINTLKKMIFPPISNESVPQLMIDDESIKYITHNKIAKNITGIIMNNLFDFPCPQAYCAEKWNNLPLGKKMKHLVITEMTAGVGGNILNFANYFKYVNAIEIDVTRFNYLEKNISLYGYDNINCYNNDSNVLLIDNDDIVQDIVFFDPPWGGKDYKLFNKLRLKFGSHSIEVVCQKLLCRKQNKMIVMKLPNNYDFGYLCDELKSYSVTKFILDRMTIIIVKNYSS